MTQALFSSNDAYRFLKVEDYFVNHLMWSKLSEVISHSYDANKDLLSLGFQQANGKDCFLLIQFIQKDTFRVRFNPAFTSVEQYPSANSRAVVMDEIDDLQRSLRAEEMFIVSFKEDTGRLELTTRTSDDHLGLSVVINFKPFFIEAYGYSPDAQQEFRVWKTANPGIYYTSNGPDDYAVIQAVNKPATAKYIGFGEQGGQSLSKNTEQLNYFNFDNMRYRQVYNCGPLDGREPLYHSDPFFLEFNGVPDHDSVVAIFINNPAQILVDIGYLNSARYMFGTRYGEMDFFVFWNQNPRHTLEDFTAIVGRPRLKPRYVLGYHQGCYGYDSRGSVEWVVNKYRDHQIPLDGLHIDVDIQNQYQTFTIDTNRFPDPASMFKNLRRRGVKCSTNITPVISNRDPNYATYQQGINQDFFVLDRRHDPDNPASRSYQCYYDGILRRPNNPDSIEGYNTGEPYIGEVSYGMDMGTSGHYPDFGRREVRKWWGTQYQYLFEMGLEMVWQDMTTPAIRDTRGDMKGFPFRLYVCSDYMSGLAPEITPAIKVWNIYAYNLHKATYHGLNHLTGRENKRNFIIGRGSFTGSHRFAGLWTGDNASEWDFLRMNIAQVLSLGMCGLAVCGQDIGGFETSNIDQGRWPSPELLIRWTVAGAFLPWFRNHYVRKGRKDFQEPFMYLDYFHEHNLPIPQPQDLYAMVLPICKYYIELRYQLMQLFYDCLFENTLDGMPICRPMFLMDPDDKSLYNDKEHFLDNQFFVGKDLLIAPITKPQSETNGGKWDVYLPQGSNWYCFKNSQQPLSQAVEGGTTIRDFDANLNMEGSHIGFIVPIYVRSGGILPMLRLEQFVGELNSNGLPNPITFHIYPGQAGSYTLYLDDGVSRSSAVFRPEAQGGDPDANNEYRKTQISHCYTDQQKQLRVVTVERIHDHYTPPLEKFFIVAILHDPAEPASIPGGSPLAQVKVANQAVPYLNAGTIEALDASETNAWFYNEDLKISYIKVGDDSAKIELLLSYA